MPSAHLTLREEDIIRLVLEFLQNRGLHIAQLGIERETGVINGYYSDDVLFLRQLILDGQWDDVLEFIQPMEALQEFDMKRFRFVILQHKYIELLCIKSEAACVMGSSTANLDSAVEEVVKVLHELEKVSPTKEDYSNLCLMLTLPRLSDHLSYKDWNPSSARVQCFRDIYPLVEKYLPPIKKANEKEFVIAKNDRLIQLVIKGMLYESCVRFCQAKATGSKEQLLQEINFSRLLDGSVGFGDSDLSLLSWLQNIPSDTFAIPFEQKTLNIDVEQIERPSLETSWTEHMLITPIKPKTFPHSAMPFTRPRSAADIMSRSLLPSLDILPNSQDNSSHSKAMLMALSAADLSSSPMVKSSFASFHLSGLKPSKSMNTSVDKLFENENDVFLSGTFDQLPSISEVHHSTPKIPLAPARSNSPDKKNNESASSTPDHRSRETSNSTTARSSRRDSLSEKPPTATTIVLSDAQATLNNAQNYDQGDLMKEFQRQKQKLHDTLIAQEQERQELLRQLQNTENRIQEDSMARTNTNNAHNAAKNNNNAVASVPQATVVVRSNTPSSAAAINQTPHNNYNNCDVVRNATNVANSNQTKINVMNGPKQLPQIVNGAKHNHLDNHYDSVKNTRQDGDGQSSNGNRPRFLPVTTLEDVQAIRCAEFHPQGSLYAVGSNSKTLRICAYPKLHDLRDDHKTCQPTVLFKRTKHHKGSIYCMAWTPIGDLLATGSNDKTVKLMKFNNDTANFEGQEIELAMHDGTVRDVCFLEDTSNKSSLLISGGAGDCKIYVTDCATGQPYQALSGHSGHILSLYNWGGVIFASGSQDRTVRFWDLRTRGCVNVITPTTVTATRQGSPVAAVCVDPSGRLLVSGHEDSSCVLYDIRGTRTLQCFKPHASDVRSIRFSPSAYYLLTAGYDNKLVLTDLQGDLTAPLPSVVVAQHQDKVISGRWHPAEFSFLSTSADKTSTLWALPPI
ncbi:WD repeat-containing protein 47 isoform X2 [Planococcus citri]